MRALKEAFNVHFEKLYNHKLEELDRITEKNDRVNDILEELKVAVMGCVVNGPGESKHAHIGISLPGAGEEPKAPVYADGKLLTILKGEGIAEEFLRLVEDYVKTRFAPKA